MSNSTEKLRIWLLPQRRESLALFIAQISLPRLSKAVYLGGET